MISRQEVDGLAKLARLELSDAEIASLQQDISGIVEYVGHIRAASFDANGAEVPPLHTVLRADELRSAGDPLAEKERALVAAFPKEQGGYDVVRAIIQKDE